MSAQGPMVGQFIHFFKNGPKDKIETRDYGCELYMYMHIYMRVYFEHNYMHKYLYLYIYLL